jgi:hypothetical protein
MFILNGFPCHMFDRCVRTFLNKVFQPKLPVHTVPKKIIYFCLPFTGTHSLQIRTQINRLCRASFPHLDIRFVFRSTKRLSTFFSFKDKIPKALAEVGCSVLFYVSMLFRIVCGSNHAPSTHPSFGTPGYHSYHWQTM